MFGKYFMNTLTADSIAFNLKTRLYYRDDWKMPLFNTFPAVSYLIQLTQLEYFTSQRLHMPHILMMTDE